MRYLLCPCCYNNLIKTNLAYCLNRQEQLECSCCKTKFLFEMAISDSDRIVPLIFEKQSDTFDWLNFVLELSQGDTMIEKNVSIDGLSVVCDNCENHFLNNISNNISCVIDYPFSTSIILKIRRKTIVEKCFKLVFVLPASNCIFPADLNPIDEFLRYTCKFVLFRCNENELHDGSDSYIKTLTILASKFRNFKNLSKSKKITTPFAIVSLHKSILNKEKDTRLIDYLSCEYKNWETFSITDYRNISDYSVNRTSLFKKLFLWIVK